MCKFYINFVIILPLIHSSLSLIKTLQIFLHQELYVCLQSGPWVIINVVGAISLMHEFVRLVTKYTVSCKITFVIFVLSCFSFSVPSLYANI